MKLRLLAVTKTTPVPGAQDLVDVKVAHVLQFKPQDGEWQDVPVVDAASIEREEKDERLAQKLAAKLSIIPSKALEIIQAARAAE